MATFQTYGQNLLNAVRNPSAAGPSNPFQALSKLRNLDSQQAAAVGVVAAEIIGFFTVGEIIGRFKVIGYRSSESAHH
jgi:F-type H+-transporting ATPase subunit g